MIVAMSTEDLRVIEEALELSIEEFKGVEAECDYYLGTGAFEQCWYALDIIRTNLRSDTEEDEN